MILLDSNLGVNFIGIFFGNIAQYVHDITEALQKGG